MHWVSGELDVHVVALQGKAEHMRLSLSAVYGVDDASWHAGVYVPRHAAAWRLPPLSRCARVLCVLTMTTWGTLPSSCKSMTLVTVPGGTIMYKASLDLTHRHVLPRRPHPTVVDLVRPSAVSRLQVNLMPT